MIKQLKIRFEGSFQCRLATDNDATNSSPLDPYGTYGAKSKGWTFAYKERKFDRIIRTWSPLQLRNAVMDSWKDVKVKTVENDQGAGFIPVKPSDVLFGLVVRFGKAKFDTKAGGGTISREALIDLELSVGDPTAPAPVLIAKPASLPQLDGVQGDDPRWATDYYTTKGGLVSKASPVDPVRLKVLTSDTQDISGVKAPTYIHTYASFFEMRIPTKPFDLKNVAFGKTVSGVLAQLESPAGTKYKWTADLAFYRFDGDTLTGQCDGQVLAAILP
jgi:hypothetical protein